MGQTLDMQNSELPKVDLSKFTETSYSGRVEMIQGAYI
jgi:hypothetical protein